MTKEEGHILCDPIKYPNSIAISYKDEEVLDRVEKKIEDMIGEIEVIKMHKRDVRNRETFAEKKVKYLQNNMAIFLMENPKELNFYLCGRTTMKNLLDKISEFRKMKRTRRH